MNRYKYLLHGHFDNNVTKIIDTARNYLFKKYTKENLEPLIKDCKSIADLIRKLNLKFRLK